MKGVLVEREEWVRGRMGMCIWKGWKKGKRKVGKVMRCGMNK